MSRFHSLAVAEVRPETRDAVSIVFRVPPELAEEYRYAAGQHLTLRTRIEGEEVRRSYSICSGLDEAELRIAVKRLDGGRFSGFANQQIKPGDCIDVMIPSGRFTTRPDPAVARIHVGFAAGSGITPVISILKTVLAREPLSRFILVYGNRTVGSIMFREELEDLKNRYMTRLSLVHVLSRERQDVELLNGRIDAGKVQALSGRLFRPDAVDAFYLCGPASLIDDVGGALRGLGVPQSRIHFELFAPPDAPPQPLRQSARGEDSALHGTARVTVIRDGVRTEFPAVIDGEPVLDAGLHAGLELPYSCRAGVCSTCRCQLRAGRVEMAANYSLEPWELEAGFILACQARALTDEVILDFDEA